MEQYYKFKKFFEHQGIETCGELQNWEGWLCSKRLGLTKKEMAKASKFVYGGHGDADECDGSEICADGDFDLKLKNGRHLGAYQTEEAVLFYITTEKGLTCDKVNLLLGGGLYVDEDNQTSKLIKKYCVEIDEKEAEKLQKSRNIPVVFTNEGDE